MNNPNADSYRSLGWILNNSEDGLFFLITTEKMQQEVISHYAASNVAICDYKQHSSGYSFNALESWINSAPQAGAYFLLNFHLAIQEVKDITRLNFSRDMLTSLQKNLIFCITQRADDILSRRAYDFYSYVKLRLFFQEEVFENTENQNIPPYIFDRSTSVGCELQMDFELPQTQLLSQAIALTNQADQLIKEFRYYDALSHLQDAQAIRERFLGEKHPDTAETYNNIAAVYNNQGDYTKALEWLQKSLVISETVLGTEHPNTAATYNNIAGVYDKQGDYAKALEWYQKALAINEKVLENEHPNANIVRDNIKYIKSKSIE